MGKRKSKSQKPAGPKKREALSTTFKCVFCSNENSVSVKVERKARIASLSCRDCGQSFQTADVNNLTHAVDVYYEWIDACDQVAKEQTTAIGSHANAPANLQSLHAADDKYSAEDNFVVDDDDDAEAAYAED